MLGHLTETDWDVVVIGSGMGGGMAGRRLAERGLSVLFLERGPTGRRAEEPNLFSGHTDSTAREIRGFWPEPVRAVVDGTVQDLWSTFGACVGGTSAFYAATLERPERHDVEAREGRPHPTGGWPVPWDGLRTYYAEAERLLEVRGAADPLTEDEAVLLPAPELSAGDLALQRSLAARGLNPYRMHVGIRYVPGCRECAGHKCPRACKMDGRSAGVEPALATGRAALLDRCHVERLDMSHGGVAAVVATRGGMPLRFRAKRYVLAAGGLGSPRLLLASRQEGWSDGVANRSGLVGRNLMFHLNEMLALWSSSAPRSGEPQRTLALRDFYFRDGARYGIVQSMGLAADYGNILMALGERFDRSPLRSMRFAREFLRLPALAAARVLGSARVLVGILEDLPLPDNRVTLNADPAGTMVVTYAISDELEARRRAFRRLMARTLRGWPMLFLNAGPQLNYGHPCGTLRFGHDPVTSVLDPDCRAHGISNLFVADSSFMPTSTGVNPSLTIAANALRVADAVVADLTRGAVAQIGVAP